MLTFSIRSDAEFREWNGALSIAEKVPENNNCTQQGNVSQIKHFPGLNFFFLITFLIPSLPRCCVITESHVVPNNQSHFSNLYSARKLDIKTQPSHSNHCCLCYLKKNQSIICIASLRAGSHSRDERGARSWCSIVEREGVGREMAFLVPLPRAPPHLCAPELELLVTVFTLHDPFVTFWSCVCLQEPSLQHFFTGSTSHVLIFTQGNMLLWKNETIVWYKLSS